MRLHAEEVVVKITVALSLPAEVLPQLIAVLEGAPTLATSPACSLPMLPVTAN
jgi:hypothetical protein